jgi:hypothetical protein
MRGLTVRKMPDNVHGILTLRLLLKALADMRERVGHQG